MLNKEFAEKINALHDRANSRAKMAVSDAIEIGKLLSDAITEHGKKTLSAWIDAGNVTIARSVAYRYVDLFEYRDQIGESKNIFVAYKQIADIKADQKRIEYKQSADRVAEYKETGKKPEGYKKNTDERRAEKHEAVQNPRRDSVPANRSKAWQKIYDERNEEEYRFLSFIAEKLDMLNNDNQRIEVCHDIIKLCKKISAELQK